MYVFSDKFLQRNQQGLNLNEIEIKIKSGSVPATGIEPGTGIVVPETEIVIPGIGIAIGVETGIEPGTGIEIRIETRNEAENDLVAHLEVEVVTGNGSHLRNVILLPVPRTKKLKKLIRKKLKKLITSMLKKKLIRKKLTKVMQ